jgi:hypothetical protein
MSEPDHRTAEIAALVELAEAKYQRFLRKKLLPERDRHLRDLKSQNLTFAGRTLHAQKIWEEFLLRGARKRIGFYGKVARGNREMLSAERLGEFRDRIMTTVGHGCGALKDAIERDARSAGNVSEAQLKALLDEKLYEYLCAKVLDAINDELRVMAAEVRVTAATMSLTLAPVTADSGIAPRSPRGRGRPVEIKDELKRKALELKLGGGTNREAAQVIYNTRHPSAQQVKNVPSILRHYEQRSKKAEQAANRSATRDQ